MLYIVVLCGNNTNKCKHFKFVRRTLTFVFNLLPNKLSINHFPKCAASAAHFGKRFVLAGFPVSSTISAHPHNRAP